METSIFLSRVIGPLFIIVSLGLIVNTADYKAMLKDVGKNPFALYIGGFIAYLFGALIIVVHNVWGWNSGVILTLVGYAGLLKGICILLFPDVSLRMANAMIAGKNCLRSAGVVTLILGAYLSYLGFFA